ncbi:hypothetical protein FA95DRAFT_792342 [Auriscalpium vulgare]|uniref:Uncharacterized protein n=1 Tax=Auriscalpium vulgare TaxID=40419 RepID=A0ACB8RA52_9AGAM|nr:hypothetical protein FA95DRAFT_792342 [Auriscalpium vulgare]
MHAKMSSWLVKSSWNSASRMMLSVLLPLLVRPSVGVTCCRGRTAPPLKATTAAPTLLRRAPEMEAGRMAPPLEMTDRTAPPLEMMGRHHLWRRRRRPEHHSAQSSAPRAAAAGCRWKRQRRHHVWRRQRRDHVQSRRRRRGFYCAGPCSVQRGREHHCSQSSAPCAAAAGRHRLWTPGWPLSLLPSRFPKLRVLVGPLPSLLPFSSWRCSRWSCLFWLFGRPSPSSRRLRRSRTYLHLSDDAADEKYDV